MPTSPVMTYCYFHPINAQLGQLRDVPDPGDFQKLFIYYKPAEGA